jgi:hypothetical protein
MKNSDWPALEILRVAETSGKPLEVVSAEAFLSAGWTARLGSYYADGALDTPRELDVLVEKAVDLFDDNVGPKFRVRVLVSCRGFPEDRSPVFYSVSSNSVPSFEPRLFVEYRGSRALAFDPTGVRCGALPEQERCVADRTLELCGLTGMRPVISMDMIERKAPEPKIKNGTQSPEFIYVRMKDGDRTLFKAADSAIKAAFYWKQEDYSRADDFVSVNIPVCVLSRPFWDVPIDHGKTGQPELRSKGYMVNLYPAHPYAKELVCLFWAAEEIPSLVTALDGLLSWFSGQINDAISTIGWGERE